MILPASEAAACQEAALCLRQGGLVAFPTETCYGLGADPFNAEALRRLFLLKRRPERKPVLVLVQDQGQVPLVAAEAPAALRRLMALFWPGPLTVVCPARPGLHALLTGGSGTVGVRQSPHPAARQLLLAFGGPVTATSANRSGEEAAVTAGEVEAIFGRELDLILDGGATQGGAGSTLIGWDGQGLRCLREGRIPFAEARRRLAEAERQEKNISGPAEKRLAYR